MGSRRWAPGDLVFQGGTSLHLAHGSPRFSEDLDFLVRDSLKIGSIEKAVQARLEGTPWIPKDMVVSVTTPREGRNPHMFDVTLSGTSVMGSVRVKVELWRAPEEALKPLTVIVKPVRLATGPAAGAQAFVPTLDPHEIFVDKVFAVAARPYLKPRDVFDLYWLEQQRGGVDELAARELGVRLATYPNETPAAWLTKAEARRRELLVGAGKVKEDLRRWLPSHWDLSDDAVKLMIEASVRALDAGCERMRELINLKAVAPPGAAADAEDDLGDDQAEGDRPS